MSTKKSKIADPLEIPPVDTLLGEPVAGYEGKYWHTIPEDPTPAGFIVSGNSIRVPRTIHLPTGSPCSYIKVFVTLKDGKEIPVWVKHQDLDIPELEQSAL